MAKMPPSLQQSTANSTPSVRRGVVLGLRVPIMVFFVTFGYFWLGRGVGVSDALSRALDIAIPCAIGFVLLHLLALALIR